MNTKFCKVEAAGHVTVITITRPEVMNALHPEANAELAGVFDRFEQDTTQRAAIITGAGERAFCAGNDLKATADATARGEQQVVPASGLAGLTSRYDLAKPVIAAVNGLALGGGFEIALACDLIVASSIASFGLPEPKVGLIALAGGLHRLPREVGLKRAMGLILTGRRVSAEEGAALGFVNEVVPAAELMACAHRWAGLVLACSPVSIRASKDAVRRGLAEVSVEAALAHQTAYPGVAALFASDDIREGPRAFAEKRAPQWRDS